MSIVIVGSRNPYSGPALDPKQPGSAGQRLFTMSDLGEKKYSRFVRANLEDGPFFFPKGTTVLVLGEEVRAAFGLPRLLIHPLTRDGVTYRQIPHPSGRTRFYNDPDCRALVKELFRCLTAERLTATTSLAVPSPRASSRS